MFPLRPQLTIAGSSHSAATKYQIISKSLISTGALKSAMDGRVIDVDFWDLKNNVACTSNYYSEKEPKYVADFLVWIIFSTAVEVWALRG
jgi:hypothetical protein